MVDAPDLESGEKVRESSSLSIRKNLQNKEDIKKK